MADLLLSPVLVRRGLARDRLGWSGLAVIIAGAGAPYALLAAGGLRFAPAYDQGALNPGFMTLFVAPIAAIVLGETLSAMRKLGLSLILAGALTIVFRHAAGWSTSRGFGDALFLSAALLWACFTVVMRRVRRDPLHAAALVSTGSLVTWLPLYLALFGTRLALVPLTDITVQAMFQGVLVTIVSLLPYGRAVAILGALVPVLPALFAIPLVGEWPDESDWIGIVCISAGAWLASGGPFPSRKQRESHHGTHRFR